MHKLFKKFGSLALVICTVVALAALPVSAQEYWVREAPDPPKTDAYGNTFTPGLFLRSEDAVFEYAKMSGVLWTHEYDLGITAPVYALAKCTLNYNDAEHSYTIEVCEEYLGVVDANERLFLYKNAQGDNAIYIENDSQNSKEWFTVSGRAMISTALFTVTNGIYRFPSRLGSFEWSKTVAYSDLVES